MNAAQPDREALAKLLHDWHECHHHYSWYVCSERDLHYFAADAVLALLGRAEVAMCACGHTVASHRPSACVGCTGPACDHAVAS